MRTLMFLAMVAACDSGAGTNEGENGDAFEPTEDCVAYLACLEAVASSELPIAEAAYGEDGSCWTDAQEALACSTQCLTDITLEHLDTPTETACWPGGLPNAGTLFTEVGTSYAPLEATPSSCDEDEFGFSAPLYWDLRIIVRKNASFLAEFSGYDLNDSPRVRELECGFTADADRTFTCEARGDSEVSGRFNPSFERVTFNVGSCEIVATQ